MRCDKMQYKLCPVCKSKFYSERTFFERKSVLHNYCLLNKSSEKRKEERPVRTSTPVADLESTPTQSFSDSVTEFFYQSWKSGLHSDDTKSYRRSSNHWYRQSPTMLQPSCFAPQVVYVNTVVFQPYMPIQQVGYRPDGTFGVLPVFWSYFGY